MSVMEKKSFGGKRKAHKIDCDWCGCKWNFSGGSDCLFESKRECSVVWWQQHNLVHILFDFILNFHLESIWNPNRERRRINRWRRRTSVGTVGWRWWWGRAHPHTVSAWCVEPWGSLLSAACRTEEDRYFGSPVKRSAGGKHSIKSKSGVGPHYSFLFGELHGCMFCWRHCQVELHSSSRNHCISLTSSCLMTIVKWLLELLVSIRFTSDFQW